MPTVQPTDFAQNHYGYNENAERITSGDNVFDMRGMKNSTVQLRLSTGAGTTLTCTAWMSNTDDAVAGSDNNWVDVSTTVLGAASVACGASSTVNGFYVLSSRLPARKFKIKTVLVGSTTPLAKIDVRSSI